MSVARFPVPDVIKIDVEGAELAVLTGGSKVLAHSPTVICEVSAQNATAVSDILTGHGYTLYDGDKRPRERVPVTAAPFNTLAIAAPRLSPAAEARTRLISLSSTPVNPAARCWWRGW